MSTFYNEWLISGKSRQEAFKEAQKKVRAKYPAPFYWAAFVMMD
jgi:CHAT domain-containing protein